MSEDVKNQSHYARHAIQPVEFIARNNLGYLEGNVIKYILRYQHKGAPEKDLAKASHYLEMLCELQKTGTLVMEK